MFKKIISLTLTVCMLLCFAACGDDGNESSAKPDTGNKNSNTSKVEVPLTAETYEEAVQMYFDAVFDPNYDSKNIKYLAPEEFWNNKLGNTSMDAVIDEHRKNKSTYLKEWYEEIELGRYYSLKELQEIIVIAPDSESYTTDIEQIEDKYKIKVDSGSTIYYVDEMVIDMYEDSNLKEHIGTLEVELNARAFQVDGVWYTHQALQYLMESPIEVASGIIYD